MLTVFDAFETTVRQSGSRIAVEVQGADGLDRFTYDALHAMALQCAAGLRSDGMRPGDRAAILAHNDASWCAAWLGMQACGVVVVPIDTRDSAAQVAAILRDSGARVILVSPRTEAVARQAAASVPGVAVRSVRDAAPLTPEDAPPAEVAQSAEGQGVADPAVILYTSGTTADPRGVVLTHANLLAERDAVRAVIDVSEQDSVLGALPLFHAMGQVMNLLLPFAAGARVVYLDTGSAAEPMQAVKERHVTIVACMPQVLCVFRERMMTGVARRGIVARLVFRALLRIAFRVRRLGVNLGPWIFGHAHRSIGRQMRLFVTGGSRVDPAIGRDLYALGFTILQAYGLTETSGAATVSTPHEAHLDTVGRPLPGVEVRIVRDHEEAGELDGEAAIRGPIVMAGYVNRPDQTAMVMQDGWLLTGDLGRLDAHGRLTITRRRKDVIPIADGQSLYLEDVETHYRQSAYVREICVTVLPGDDRPPAERLFAVVVPDMALLDARRIVNAGDLLRFELEGLGASLPPHARIRGYDVWFEPLPRTATGTLARREVDRRLAERRLRHASPETDAAEDGWPDDVHAAPAVAIVRAHAAAGARLVPSANLEMDLGLDSMQRVEVLAALEHRFRVRVSADQAHRIFTLGQLVDAVRPTDTPGAEGQAVAVDVDPPLPADAPLPAHPLSHAGTSPWSAILRDLPPETDPTLSGLLDARLLLAPILYAGAQALSRLLARVEVTGIDRLPADGAFIVSPNHQGYPDPFFVCAALPYRVFARTFFVGAVEYFETPLMAWVARKVNCVPVDPDANLVPAMQAGAFGLAHGRVLMLFPEGERSIDGTVKRFKKGAPILSRHMRVPVVPVAIRGVHELWPRGGSLDWRALLPWRRRRVRLAFGEPMAFADETSDQDAAHQLRDAVERIWQAI